MHGERFISLEWRVQHSMERVVFQAASSGLVDDRGSLFMGIGCRHYCGDDSGIERSGMVDGAVLSVGLDCDGPQLGNDSPQWAVCLSGHHDETTQPRRKPPHRTD